MYFIAYLTMAEIFLMKTSYFVMVKNQICFMVYFLLRRTAKYVFEVIHN